MELEDIYHCDMCRHVCDGDEAELGMLGTRLHYRCPGCGHEDSIEITNARKED